LKSFDDMTSKGAEMATKRLKHQVGDPDALTKAWKSVQAAGGAAGVDGLSIPQFAEQLENRLAKIQNQIVRGTYRYSRLRSAAIPKANGKQRLLGIPIVADRVVLQAVRQAIEPMCEPHLLDCSHAYRPQRSALTAMAQLTTALGEGLRFVLESDIRKFFDTINHAALLSSLKMIHVDLPSEPLLVRAITLSRGWWPVRKGVCQGSPLSPLLANVALIPFDQQLIQQGYRMVRYADDFVVLCRSRADCLAAQQAAQRSLSSLGLELHPDKTRTIDNDCQSFNFLGFEIQPDRIAPAADNLAQLKSGILAWCNPRETWHWQERIDQINSLLRSFAWYYHQIDTRRLFLSLDAFALENVEELATRLDLDRAALAARLIRISEMREISWAGKRKRKAKSWGGYR